MSWLTIKAKLYAAAAALLGIIGLVLRNRYLADKAERQKHRADVAEAGLRRRKQIDAADAEIENEFSDREQRAKEDRRNDEVPGNLSDSDTW